MVFSLSYVLLPVFTRGNSDLCEDRNYWVHRSWQVTSLPSSPLRVQTGLKNNDAQQQPEAILRIIVMVMICHYHQQPKLGINGLEV